MSALVRSTNTCSDILNLTFIASVVVGWLVILHLSIGIVISDLYEKRMTCPNNRIESISDDTANTYQMLRNNRILTRRRQNFHRLYCEIPGFDYTYRIITNGAVNCLQYIAIIYVTLLTNASAFLENVVTVKSVRSSKTLESRALTCCKTRVLQNSTLLTTLFASP